MDIDKLVIREGRVEDAAGIIAFRQEVAMEPGIGIATDPGEFHYTVEQEEDVIRKHQEMENSVLMVVVTPEGEIVGLMGCSGGRRRSTAHETSLGITLNKGYRDKGLGTRVMQAALDWARSSGVVKRVQLEVFSNNERGSTFTKSWVLSTKVSDERRINRKESGWTPWLWHYFLTDQGRR